MAKSDIKAAIVLINMGGPETLDEVPGFMRRLFSDRHIMNIPCPIRAIAAQVITFTRVRRGKKAL